jgi:TRAP-type C4-dicarboxylate transport system permease small subunit
VRRALDFLYDAAAWLAALAMIGVLAMVLAAIVTRQLGINFQGTDAYAGYSMAAAGFLALAHTLKHNEHIRVTLLLQHLKRRALHRLEMWALSAAVVLSALFAFYSIRLAWNSHAFNDISTGNDATPLWIPQLTMAIGAVILCIAFMDEWWLQFRGLRQVHTPAEALHNE